jgi:chemotaxis signal transduction protein
MNPELSPSPDHAESQSSVEVIRCGLGEEIYCLEMSDVKSVMPVGDLRAPGEREDAGVVGMMEFQGEDVPVYDLAAKLNRPAKRAHSGHYIVLISHPLRMYGLRVDSVSRVIRLAPDNVLPLPKPIEHTRRWFKGIADFTRDRRVNVEWRASRHLPGISEPKEVPPNRRRGEHQMQLLLNPKTLLMDNPSKFGPAPPKEYLLRRYASVASVEQPRSSRQLVVFPVGVRDDCPLLLGLSISQVAEIAEPHPAISIPGVNPNIAGFADWRNCPVPILNLQATLGCRPASETVSNWVVARDHHTRGLVALPVSGRVHSIRLPIDHRPCELPVKSWSQFVLGTFEFEACVLILPRLDALSEFIGDA